MKKMFLTIAHFRLTLLLLTIGGIAAHYFNFGTVENYILGAFFALAHPVVERFSIIGREIESDMDIEPLERGPSWPERSRAFENAGSFVQGFFQFIRKIAMSVSGFLLASLNLLLAGLNRVLIGLKWLLASLIVLFLIGLIVFFLWSRYIF